MATQSKQPKTQKRKGKLPSKRQLQAQHQTSPAKRKKDVSSLRRRPISLRNDVDFRAIWYWMIGYRQREKWMH
jgi:hypothetical protein